jgi:acetyltransferase-like isoleucine patch superfamily enzyme
MCGICGKIDPRGVTIGDGAVIGACSLVNKAIPKNSIAFGVPAKVRKIKDEDNITTGEKVVASG